MNSLDKKYQDLLQDILDNGIQKTDRTGTGTLSVFGRQIRHKMSDGFPLLTTKKMPFKTMVTELVWFLRGDTNIKFLVDNNCHIWDGDAYKNYAAKTSMDVNGQYTKEEFINKIKTDDEFAKKWGELGPIYGAQWRNWNGKPEQITNYGGGEINPYFCDCQERFEDGHSKVRKKNKGIDQIQNLINDLKTNPDSRRLMVNSWNVSEISQMVLPPCHYGFQVYTRELSFDERCKIQIDRLDGMYSPEKDIFIKSSIDEVKLMTMNKNNIPTRAISLMWNQRSVDTFLGLPFNIASYGLLLMMISDEVNMVPDELIGNLGDTHLYLNHVDQAKEQIGEWLKASERMDWWFENNKPNRDVCDYVDSLDEWEQHQYFDESNVPRKSREPFELPKVHVRDGIFSFMPNDVILENYKSHPAIKAPLSN